MRALAGNENFGDFFTDDVTFTVLHWDLHVAGRDAVVDTINYLHRTAFDAHPEMTNLIAGDRGAAAEFVFKGKHVDEFRGVPAAGRVVELPYSAVYDLADGKISALRIYMSLPDLLRQLQEDVPA